MADHAHCNVAAQREDSAILLQFENDTQRVTITCLPSYGRSIADVTLGAAGDSSRQPHLAIVKATIQVTEKKGKRS